MTREGFQKIVVRMVISVQLFNKGTKIIGIVCQVDFLLALGNQNLVVVLLVLFFFLVSHGVSGPAYTHLDYSPLAVGACRQLQGVAAARTLIGEQTQQSLTQWWTSHWTTLVVCRVICYYYIKVNSSLVMCIIYQWSYE